MYAKYPTIPGYVKEQHDNNVYDFGVFIYKT